MIILGIETSTMRVGAALGGYEGVLAEFHTTRGRRHAETLTPAIEFICAQARVAMTEISAVAVDVGPGLFTGLRVGVSTAKAIAQALRVPMIGLSSLDLLAFPVRYSDRVVVPVIDARRSEVYYAKYRQVPGGLQRLSDYRLASPRELASELMAASEESLVIGDGALRYGEVLTTDVRVELGTVGTAYPTAGALVELAHPRAVREEFVQPSELEVLYLRRSDAEINWEARHQRPGAEAG
ncbi:MAG TPA: tRNA (adenosine(37)-N6)-threonylcarbamoyltransferase complex dimerization subunit type 1 TsaB [Acidimicrobiales bacterium]|nr:tRNA (adenosine(37)-N6)-threonylcarbamoyltransferase complex dimerization subunit type 1 TsaB [Acidimicrobiales bacterium]